MDAEATYQLIRDELALDGTPALNLASFVHTWMPRQADQLMMENISKNLIDQDEYPMTRAFPPFAATSVFSLTRVCRGHSYSLRVCSRGHMARTFDPPSHWHRYHRLF